MEDSSVVLNWPQKTAKARTSRKKPAISHEIQGQIGERLRSMYGDLKAEPIPDRFIELLKQLDIPRSGENPGSGENS
jgi:hypothetical protein